MNKILFVCLGNICRSPMAQAIFEKIANEKKLKVWADSAGTSHYHIGEQPDSRTLHVLKNNGIYFHHIVRQIKPSDSETFDWILAMDQTNLSDIQKILPNGRAKIRLLREFEPINTGELNVPDPYYGSLADFEEVYTILNRSIKNFIANLSAPYYDNL